MVVNCICTYAQTGVHSKLYMAYLTNFCRGYMQGLALANVLSPLSEHNLREYNTKYIIVEKSQSCTSPCCCVVI